MPSGKNLRLSMAPPSHVVIMDCIGPLQHRASRAGTVSRFRQLFASDGPV
jgi:hypothetical protein